MGTANKMIYDKKAEEFHSLRDYQMHNIGLTHSHKPPSVWLRRFKNLTTMEDRDNWTYTRRQIKDQLVVGG